jgi:hypothetical protein
MPREGAGGRARGGRLYEEDPDLVREFASQKNPPPDHKILCARR